MLISKKYKIFRRVFFIFLGIFFLGIFSYAATEINDIGTSNIDGLVTLGNLVTNFVNTTHILDRTITANDIADNSINDTHLSVTGFPVRLGSGVLTIEPGTTDAAGEQANSSNFTIGDNVLSVDDTIKIEWNGINSDPTRVIHVKFEVTNSSNIQVCHTTSAGITAGNSFIGVCNLVQQHTNNSVILGRTEYISDPTATDTAQRFDIVAIGDSTDTNIFTKEFTLSLRGFYGSGTGTQYTNITYSIWRYPF